MNKQIMFLYEYSVQNYTKNISAKNVGILLFSCDFWIIFGQLKKPPQLFEEVSSDPRRHPMWQPIPDFTEDQSRLYRYVN